MSPILRRMGGHMVASSAKHGVDGRPVMQRLCRGESLIFMVIRANQLRLEERSVLGWNLQVAVPGAGLGKRSGACQARGTVWRMPPQDRGHRDVSWVLTGVPLGGSLGLVGGMNVHGGPVGPACAHPGAVMALRKCVSGLGNGPGMLVHVLGL